MRAAYDRQPWVACATPEFIEPVLLCSSPGVLLCLQQHVQLVSLPVTAFGHTKPLSSPHCCTNEKVHCTCAPKRVAALQILIRQLAVQGQHVQDH